ncbi:MAG: hypothetical protein Tsb0013_05850 [Phycisphaerales bacterium]
MGAMVDMTLGPGSSIGMDVAVAEPDRVEGGRSVSPPEPHTDKERMEWARMVGLARL